MNTGQAEKKFDTYISNQKIGIKLVTNISNLMLNHSVELVLFRNRLHNQSLSQVLKLHAENLAHQGVDVKVTEEISACLLTMQLAPSTIDVGKLAIEFSQQTESVEDFLRAELKPFLSEEEQTIQPKDVVLFGLGRIGRLLCRELIKQVGRGQQLRLKAIVLRHVDEASLLKRASLLSHDSVHGDFKAIIDVDTENFTLTINGQTIHLIDSKQPEDIDYTAYGIHDALVIDNTGAYTTKEELSRHLAAKGASKVILTAPGKDFQSVVFGVNQGVLDIDSENIFSAASCTTNAISPVLDSIEANFGVDKGHIETIHAYTNDQNLLDNMHKKPRRGRSAAVNMVITSTGAGKAVAQVIPCLEGKFTSNAVRVPTPNGSLAILQLSLKEATTVEALNDSIREAALDGKLANQINYSAVADLVSSDIIGNDCCSVFDSNATLVSGDGKNAVLYVWYDNEHGYTMQVMRLA